MLFATLNFKCGGVAAPSVEVLFSARQALAMDVFPDAIALTKFLTQLASGVMCTPVAIACDLYAAAHIFSIELRNRLYCRWGDHGIPAESNIWEAI